MEFPHIWIEKQYRADCLAYTAKATGMRITYDEGLDPELIKKTDELIAYLRKRYFFPVRINIAVTNHRGYASPEDGHKYYGIFYHNVDVCPKRKIYPRIAVAGAIWKHLTIEDVLFTLLHELTHYFQWFFDEEKYRSDRRLEREANLWANSILYYFNKPKEVL